MASKTKRYKVTKLAESRYSGVREAARGLRVSRQAIYMVLAGFPKALGAATRARLEIVDRTK